jgi:hypothetical protein
MNHNGHQAYRQADFLHCIALFEQEDSVDEISDRVMRELALSRPKTYVERQMAVLVESVVAFYEGSTSNTTIIELSNGYMHLVKSPYSTIEILIS